MKCPQCFNGFVQTSFGPKPCPTCHGKGENPDQQNTNNKSGSYKKMSYLSIIFYCALAGVIGYHLWLPLGFFVPVVLWVYFEEYHR